LGASQPSDLGLDQVGRGELRVEPAQIAEGLVDEPAIVSAPLRMRGRQIIGHVDDRLGQGSQVRELDDAGMSMQGSQMLTQKCRETGVLSFSATQTAGMLRIASYFARQSAGSAGTRRVSDDSTS
jgi:hypothetical protein